MAFHTTRPTVSPKVLMNLFLRSPLLLYSYLATEMLAPFFASFLVMNGVFLLVKLIPFLNFALDLGIGFADFVRLLSYMLPKMLIYTIPMSSMMGIILCFSRLSNDTEILALKAGGISIYQILPSVVAVAGTIALATAYVSVTLIPQSDKAMKQLSYQLLKEKMDKGIKEHQFTEALGDLVVHVGRIDQGTGEWHDVWVSDMRGQESPAITMASTGSMTSDISKMNVTILLRNGSLHRPDGVDAQIVKFDTYVIHIPLQLPTQVKVKERDTLSLSELLAAADRQGLDNESGRDLLVEFHKRLVLPVGCLIMSLLGLPLGLLAGPGKKAIGIPLGLASFIFYYILFTTAKTMSEDGVLPALLLMWAPNALFLLAAFSGIWRVTHELPVIPESLQRFCTRLFAMTIRPPMQRLAAMYQAVRMMLLSRRLHPENAELASNQAERGVLADPESNLFHLPGCSQCEKDTCTVEFDSADEALDADFQPCEGCFRPSAENADGKK